jgi:hypothetical protein
VTGEARSHRTPAGGVWTRAGLRRTGLGSGGKNLTTAVNGRDGSRREGPPTLEAGQLRRSIATVEVQVAPAAGTTLAQHHFGLSFALIYGRGFQ